MTTKAKAKTVKATKTKTLYIAVSIEGEYIRSFSSQLKKDAVREAGYDGRVVAVLEIPVKLPYENLESLPTIKLATIQA